MTNIKQVSAVEAAQMLIKHCMAMGQMLLMGLDDNIEAYELAEDGSKDKEILLRDLNNFLCLYKMLMTPFPETTYQLNPDSIAIIEKAESIKNSNPRTIGKEKFSYGIKYGLRIREDMGDKN